MLSKCAWRGSVPGKCGRGCERLRVAPGGVLADVVGQGRAVLGARNRHAAPEVGWKAWKSWGPALCKWPEQHAVCPPRSPHPTPPRADRGLGKGSAWCLLALRFANLQSRGAELKFLLKELTVSQLRDTQRRGASEAFQSRGSSAW